MTVGADAAPSYRALLDVPWLPRILTAMLLSRIAQSMVSIALVLFTLTEYGSPALAGLVTLASILPGLLVAPIAGALLDRHGRMQLDGLMRGGAVEIDRRAEDGHLRDARGRQ